jgi:serine/threonine-protein kinase
LTDAASHSSLENDRPTARGLALAVALAGVHALWALFQWTQLVAARSGGPSFCSFGDSGSCTEVWDSGFATAIQEWTGVPVAGWGLVWSLAASALPLLALTRRVGADGKAGAIGSIWAATLWIALAGIVAIVVLFAVSVYYGHLCATCVVTYTLVASFAATCFVQTKLGSVPLAPGVSVAAGALAVGFVLLFVPGLRTPMTESAEARKVLLEATAEQLQQERAASARDREQPVVPGIDSLSKLLAELPPQLLQVFSDELHRYRMAPHVSMRPARALIGPSDAPVRLTEFADALCSHCASLHETLSQLRDVLPGAFALESRHFPLDTSCNATLKGDAVMPVRCLAARAAICAENRPGAFEYAGRVFQQQRTLDEEQVRQLAEPVLSADALEACIGDPATEAKLQEDIAWASELGIEGTPLVLINGKPVAPFGPLLYALILTRGDPDHEVYANLPVPDPRDPHEGHDH